MTDIVLMKVSNILVPHDEAVKCCTKCGAVKRLAEFAKSKKSRDGRQPQCKACDAQYQAAYRAKHKEDIRLYNQQYAASNKAAKSEYDRGHYKENQSEIRERSAAWAKANPEKVKAAWRRHYVGNKAKIVERAIAWNRANRLIASARIADWRRRHPEAYRVYRANRRARIKQAGGSFTLREIKALLTKQKGRCACCRKSIRKAFHADHIVALANGGENLICNIQLLCPRCNLEKSSKDPVSFMQSKGFLL
ncbi:hypothetical protein GTP38_11065 [Duganella sp. FT94W]|uniref:HNH nuclease domain-containing protein n=1 Tax=Duganella lactea TaxID=2692173 RepID=A0ABW9V5A8_9BURK|nr:HNH endonuclease [Duganella lactea]MYM34879.1 hypothetical protein [Duganella lactea]